MKTLYKILQLLFVVAALVQICLGRIEYAIFAMLWVIFLELLYFERSK